MAGNGPGARGGPAARAPGPVTGGPGAGLLATAPDGGVAVVGPRAVALAVARLLVCDELARRLGPAGARCADAPAHGRAAVDADPGLRVRHRPGDEDAWAWCRWLVPGSTTAGDGAAGGMLLVADRVRARGTTSGPAGDGAWLARRSADGARVLVVESDPARVPPWCATVLRVAPGGATVTLTRASRPPEPVPLRGVSTAWAERQARLLAALAHRRATTAAGAHPTSTARVPDVVAFADLPGIPEPDAEAVLHRWGHDPAGGAGHGGGPDPGPGLAAALGAGPGGTGVVLDLVRDGPHGLVAGTTGAGKSELLQTWVLALALTQPPDRLAVLLVDYKGGAGLGACTGLPHVVGQVTDLDPAGATRALTGLRAELRRRERLLAAHGVPDLPSLRRRAPDAAPPRLLVVVDEFRALVDDLPGFVPGLLRVAAQGRSLGVHLLLATQRPGGAVSADLRANLGVRIALRVTDTAESLDVLDVPDAAWIGHRAVGRALVRRGSAAAEVLQVAHVGTASRPRGIAVHRAAAWPPGGNRPDDSPPAVAAVPCRHPAALPARSETGTGAGAPPGQTSRTGQPPPGDPVTAWVAAARAAAHRAGLRPPAPPWLAPLPDLVTADALVPTSVHGAAPPEAARLPGPDRLPFALADLPDQQRRAVVTWRPGDGPLLAVGGSGSGCTVLLRTLAAAALDRGWHVHAVTSGTPVLDVRPGHPGAGTAATTDDPLGAARLLRRLADAVPGPVDRPTAAGAVADPGALGASPAPRLLIVDGLDTALAALGAVARGRGADLLVELIRDARRHGLAVAATASPALPQSLARIFGDRLVLPVGDVVAESMAGVPAALCGGRRGPGRAVWLPGTATALHPAAPTTAAALATPRTPGSDPGATPPGTDRPRPEGSPLVPVEPALCQVAVPARSPAAAHAARSPAGSHAAPGTPALRIVPVPRAVTADALRRAVAVAVGPGPAGAVRAGAPAVAVPAIAVPAIVVAARVVPADPGGRHGLDGVPVGLGGDDGGPVGLAVERGALVTGPAGSGRSTVLAVVAGRLLDDGRRVVLVARDGPLRALGEARAPDRTCGHSAAGISRALDDARQRDVARCGGVAGPVVVVVDDLDVLEQLSPGAAQGLVDLAAEGDPDPDDAPVHPAGGSPGTAPGTSGRPGHRVVVVAAARTGAATVAYRGLLGALRARRRGLVLDPGEPGSAEVFGVDLSWVTDPTRRHAPGSGAVVHGRDVVPVQVADVRDAV